MKNLLSHTCLTALVVLLASCRLLDRPTPVVLTPTARVQSRSTSTLEPMLPTTIPPPPTPTFATRITPAATIPRQANRFGVLTALGATTQPESIRLIKDLGGNWVRINLTLDGRTNSYTHLLDAGLNLVITINYADSTNIDTRFGTPKEWSRAGFPYKTKATFQKQVRDALTPALPYLAAGRLVWVQAENEISDAGVNPKALYWRGTVDQYLAQFDAFQDAVHSVSRGIPVVLTSFASETLGAANDGAAVNNDGAAVNSKDTRSSSASALVTKLLSAKGYDAVDLHMYGCVEDIALKIEWVKARLPAGKWWISTESGGPDTRCATTPVTYNQNSKRFEELQALQVPERLGACADDGGRICLWFSLYDLVNESSDVFAHLGLLDPRTAPPRAKPAYDAFKQFVAKHQP